MCVPIPIPYGTLTTGTSTTITTILPFSAGMEEALTQVEISVKEALNTTTTEQFFYAELFLERLGGSERLLLDRGIVVAGMGQRNFVGLVGRVGYSDGDRLIVVLNNISLADVMYNISAAYETWPSDPNAYKGNCQGFTRLSKRVRVYWAARRVATQANAGGGKILVDVSTGTGQCARLVSLFGINSGTNSLLVQFTDEDNAASGAFVATGSAAGVAASLPHVPASAGVTTASGELAASLDLIIPPGMKLTIGQGGAGAQGDTLTIAIVLELLGNYGEPTWDKSRSTNAGDVTLAGSTISAANTYHVVIE